MKKYKQETFGDVSFEKPKGYGNCDCGNSAKVRVSKHGETNYYCRNCARKSWLQEVENE